MREYFWLKAMLQDSTKTAIILLNQKQLQVVYF